MLRGYGWLNKVFLTLCRRIPAFWCAESRLDDEVFGSYYDAKLNTVTVPVDVNVLLGRRAKHKFEGALGVNLGCYHERFKLQGGGIKVGIGRAHV